MKTRFVIRQAANISLYYTVKSRKLHWTENVKRYICIAARFTSSWLSYVVFIKSEYCFKVMLIPMCIFSLHFNLAIWNISCNLKFIRLLFCGLKYLLVLCKSRHIATRLKYIYRLHDVQMCIRDRRKADWNSST